MHEKVYVLSYKSAYFGYTGSRQSYVLVCRNRQNIDYIRKHVKYAGRHIEDIGNNQLLLKTHYNVHNDFRQCPEIDPKQLKIQYKKLYNFVIMCGINNTSVALVESLSERDDGDLQMVHRQLKKPMPLDDDVIKFNLDFILRQ